MSKKYVADPFSIPHYQSPDVIAAIQKAWTNQQNGSSTTESSFAIHGQTRDGKPIIRAVPDTRDYHKETFLIAPGDKAIVHTHPNNTDPKPSDADRAIADKYGVDMYTMTRDGLYKYTKGMKDPQLVQSGSDTSKWDTAEVADAQPNVASLPVTTRTDPYVVAFPDNKVVAFPPEMSQDDVEKASAQIHQDSQTSPSAN